MTNEHKNDKNLTVPLGMSFLFSTSILATLMPQRIPKQIPIMMEVRKYVPNTLRILLLAVVLKFSQ